MFRKTLVILGIALLLGTCFGCRKSGERVVCTVGTQTIKTLEVEKPYVPEGLTTPEEKREAKETILEPLIEERLKLSEALEKGYDEREDLKKLIEDKKKMLSVNQLYQIEVVDKTKVRRSELKRAYELGSHELDLKHIVVSTEEEAKSVHSSLAAGANFDSLAKALSIDRNSKEKGGALGWTRYGRVADELFIAGTDLDIGQYSKPIEALGGWHILSVLEKKTIEQNPFEDEKERLENRVQQKKMRDMANAYLEGVKVRADIQYDQDVLKVVAEKVPEGKASPWAPAPLPVLTEEELSRVILTTRNGEWEVGKVMEFAQNTPPRAPIDTPEALRQWLEMLVLQELLVDEAFRKRMDRTKSVRDEIEFFSRSQIVGTIQNDMVLAGSEPTDEELATHFKENKDKYAISEKNYVSLIVTAEEDMASSVLKVLKKGGKFSEIAKEKSIHPSKRRGGDLGVVNVGRNPELFKAAKKAKLDRLYGPLQVKDGWAIYKVTKREPKKARSLQEARQMVFREMKHTAMVQKEAEWLTSLREKYPVKIDYKVLDAIGRKKEKEMKKKEAAEKKAS